MSGRLWGVTVGHTTVDRYGDDTCAGGSAWYGARTLAALGARATLCTSFGPALAAHTGALRGLDVRCGRARHTTTFRNTHDEQGRRTQVVESVAPSVPVAVLGQAETTPDVLFLAPVFGEVDLAAWLAACPARLVGIGCQGWLKTRGGPLPGAPGRARVVPKDWPPEAETLRGVDVAVLSTEDVAGREHLLSRLTETVPLVALTRGAQGCTLIERGRETHVPAAPAREVDPTGAGDTFGAALMFGLARGLSPADAARLGARCAARVVEARGGLAFDRGPLVADRPRDDDACGRCT